MLSLKKIIISSLATSVFTAHGADPLPVSKEYWKSSAFKKAFNGSYRINGRIEPFVDTKERVLLVSVEDLMAKGDRAGALKKLKASSLIGTSAAVMFNAANFAFETGDLDDAKKYYLAAIKKFPTFMRAHQNLAYVYARESDYDKAFPSLLEVVKLGSQDGSVMGLLGYCYQQKENFTSALQAFKNAQLTEPENLEWKVGEAFCYDSLGEDTKALNLYETLVKEKPENTQYKLLLINLYQKIGRNDDAIVNLELLRRQKQLDVAGSFQLGALHFSDGSEVIGANIVREILKSEEFKDANLAMNAVDYSIQRGDFKLALEFHGLIKPELIKAITTQASLNKPERRYQRQEAQILLSNALGLEDEEQAKQTSKGVSVLKSLIANDPLDADSLFLLAMHEANNQQQELAVLHYEQASKGNGRYKNLSVLERGKLLVKMLRYEEALKDLKEYRSYAEEAQSKQLHDYIDAVENLAQASQ